MAKRKIAREVASVRIAGDEETITIHLPLGEVDPKEVSLVHPPMFGRFRLSRRAFRNLKRIKQGLVNTGLPCTDVISGGPEPIVLTEESNEGGALVIALNKALESIE